MEVIDIVEIVVNLSVIIGIGYVFAKVVKAENKKQQNQ